MEICNSFFKRAKKSTNHSRRNIGRQLIGWIEKLSCTECRLFKLMRLSCLQHLTQCIVQTRSSSMLHSNSRLVIRTYTTLWMRVRPVKPWHSYSSSSQGTTVTLTIVWAWVTDRWWVTKGLIARRFSSFCLFMGQLTTSLLGWTWVETWAWTARRSSINDLDTTTLRRDLLRACLICRLSLPISSRQFRQSIHSKVLILT